jgi:hemoglobin
MMNRHVLRLRCLTLGVGLLGLVGMLSAGQEKPPTERKDVDQQLYTSLRDVINKGRDYYNAGNPAACYYMFHGALTVSAPMLDHRPELLKTVRDGLAEADANPDVRQKVWILRGVMDKVRAEVRGEVAAAPPDKKPDGKPPVGEPIGKPMPVTTLWQKLGGEPAVTKVIDDFVAIAGEDPKVNFTRDGKIKVTEEQVAALKKSLVAFVSQASGGPIKYTGKSMKEVHKDMAITDAEFDASKDALQKAMEKNGVKEEEMKAVLGAVEGTRKDIVTKKE